MQALPVNIKDIVSGHSAEWERIEFRKGWNPERCLGSPKPKLVYDMVDRIYFTIEFPLHPAFKKSRDTRGTEGQPTPPVTPPFAPPVKKLVELLANRELGNAEIRDLLSLKDRKHLRERYIDPALKLGLVEYTIPGKPNSRLQKYRLTEKGRKIINRIS